MAMEIHKLHYPEKVVIGQDEQYSLAIGFFDGLHKGHQKVIGEAQKKAEELGIRSAVMTFDPHPSHLFGDGSNKVGYITHYQEKVRLLRSMGVDTLFVVTFDWALASLSPEQFVDTFIKKLGIKHVTAGFDFTFGSKGVGTMDQMTALSGGAYGTTVVAKVTDGDEKISSSLIRELLAEGNVEETASSWADHSGQSERSFMVKNVGVCSVFRQRTSYLITILSFLPRAYMPSVLQWMARRLMVFAT